MRLVVARCSVDYAGRLDAHLPPAVRLIMVKADGCVAIHADGGAYKPLSDRDIQRINDTAMDILENIGIADPIPEITICRLSDFAIKAAVTCRLHPLVRLLGFIK